MFWGGLGRFGVVWGHSMDPKYWVGLERSRDHSNKDLRHLITTAYVI